LPFASSAIIISLKGQLRNGEKFVTWCFTICFSSFFRPPARGVKKKPKRVKKRLHGLSLNGEGWTRILANRRKPCFSSSP
jgi:hypothetical protein